MRKPSVTWKSLWRRRRCYSVGSCFATTASTQHVAFSATVAQGGVRKARAQQAENEAWAKTPGAREVLAQPPFDADGGGTTSTMLDSLEDFLQARRWNHPPEKGPARRFLSHLLTYPLTLAAGLHEAGLGFPAEREPSASTANSGRSASPDCNSAVNKETAVHHRVAVVCIGARAESTLPPSFWRETLFALPGVSGLDLHLIGPELSLPAGLAPPTESGNPTGGGLVTVRVGDRTAGLSSTRAVLRRTTGICVGVTQAEADEGEGVGAETAANAAAGAIADRAVARADAFVLFNPGLGHPHLREGWEGAAERLIASGKPIIVSCHSQIDLERDARRLKEIGERCYGEGWATGRGVEIFPRKNAFCSLMVSEDPLSKPGAEELVSSNWGLLVVRGAQRRDEDAAVDRGRILNE